MNKKNSHEQELINVRSSIIIKKYHLYEQEPLGMKVKSQLIIKENLYLTIHEKPT